MSLDHLQDQFDSGVSAIQSTFSQIQNLFGDENQNLKDENKQLKSRIASLEYNLTHVTKKYNSLRNRLCELTEDSSEEVDTPLQSNIKLSSSASPSNDTITELTELLAQDRTPIPDQSPSISTMSPFMYSSSHFETDRIDPKVFYREVKEHLPKEQFIKFAAAIRSYNQGDFTSSEILETMRGIGLSGALYSNFVRLLAQTK
ncbi:hypothetical protein GEMRC1_003612 [Eukaryota sp. GEM-RC1]